MLRAGLGQNTTLTELDIGDNVISDGFLALARWGAGRFGVAVPDARAAARGVGFRTRSAALLLRNDGGSTPHLPPAGGNTPLTVRANGNPVTEAVRLAIEEIVEHTNDAAAAVGRRRRTRDGDYLAFVFVSDEHHY